MQILVERYEISSGSYFKVQKISTHVLKVLTLDLMETIVGRLGNK